MSQTDPQGAASASPCRFRAIPSFWPCQLPKTGIWRALERKSGHGSMAPCDGSGWSTARAVWNGWQTNRVHPGGMTGWVTIDPSPARRSWYETLSAWLSCGFVVSKQRRWEVKLSRCETSTRRTQASTRPRLTCKLTAPFRQPL